jgi:hypothetical protein
MVKVKLTKPLIADRAKEAKKLLDELLLINSGKGIAKDIHDMLVMSMQSESWDNMTMEQRTNLTFRVLAVNEFFVDVNELENKKL